MASTTVNQFMKLFPASVAPSSLLNGKGKLTLKVQSCCGDKTVDELFKLVDSIGARLHLYQIKKGCISIVFLFSEKRAANTFQYTGATVVEYSMTVWVVGK